MLDVCARYVRMTRIFEVQVVVLPIFCYMASLEDCVFNKLWYLLGLGGTISYIGDDLIILLFQIWNGTRYSLTRGCREKTEVLIG